MKAEEPKDAIYVTMEILSNWGSPAWVGLTEVEFFDLNNTKLYVSPHDVDIRNTDTPGDLGQLVNRNAVSGGGPGARLGWCFNTSLPATRRGEGVGARGEGEGCLPVTPVGQVGRSSRERCR